MKEFSRNFGRIDDFSEGDLVFWSFLSPKREKGIGIINKIFENEVGGRSVSYATVYSMKNKVYIDILIANLTKLQKNEHFDA
jgi:hypothetical protein